MHDTARKPSATDGATWISKSVPEVAELIGISERYAWHLVGTGQLRSFKLGTRRFVRRVDVEQFIADLADEERALRHRVAV